MANHPFLAVTWSDTWTLRIPLVYMSDREKSVPMPELVKKIDKNDVQKENHAIILKSATTTTPLG